MQRYASILYFLAAALVVIMVGGLAGWYFFVNRQISETRAEDSARGFMTGAPSFGGAGSSGFETPLSGASDTSTTTSSVQAKPAPRLWKVSGEAVAGFGFRATSTELLFVESATGNVFRANPETSELVRVTTTLYPKVQDALVRSEGVVLRFVEGEEIQTLLALYATSTDAHESQVLKGKYLAPNILDIAATPNKTLTYLVPDGTGSAIMQTDWKGNTPKKIYASPLLGWRLQVAPDGGIVLAQKTTDSIAGYAFTLSGTGTITPLEGGVAGLAVAPRGGGARLYSSSNGTLQLFARMSGTADAQLMPIRTIADKCVWAPGNIPAAYCAVPQNVPGAQFLAERDQGSAHSTDAWYRIHALNGTADPLYSPDPSLALDVEQPVIDPSGSYIAFRNAADRSLWVLRIAQ